MDNTCIRRVWEQIPAVSTGACKNKANFNTTARIPRPIRPGPPEVCLCARVSQCALLGRTRGGRACARDLERYFQYYPALKFAQRAWVLLVLYMYPRSIHSTEYYE